MSQIYRGNVSLSYARQFPCKRMVRFKLHDNINFKELFYSPERKSGNFVHEIVHALSFNWIGKQKM